MCDWLLMDPLNKIQGGKAEAGSPGKQLLWGGAGGRVRGQGGRGEMVSSGGSGLTMGVEATGCADQMDIGCEGRGVGNEASCLGLGARGKSESASHSVGSDPL